MGMAIMTPQHIDRSFIAEEPRTFDSPLESPCLSAGCPRGDERDKFNDGEVHETTEGSEKD